MTLNFLPVREIIGTNLDKLVALDADDEFCMATAVPDVAGLRIRVIGDDVITVNAAITHIPDAVDASKIGLIINRNFTRTFEAFTDKVGTVQIISAVGTIQPVKIVKIGEFSQHVPVVGAISGSLEQKLSGIVDDVHSRMFMFAFACDTFAIATAVAAYTTVIVVALQVNASRCATQSE